MSKILSEEALAKLPAWARKHLEDVERERDVAIKTLEDFKDQQTQSAFSYDDHIWKPGVVGPVTIRRFVQTHTIEVEHGGVWLRVLCRNDSPRTEEGIEIQWGEAGSYQAGHVAFVPTSFQQASLIHPTLLRFRERKLPKP